MGRLLIASCLLIAGCSCSDPDAGSSGSNGGSGGSGGSGGAAASGGSGGGGTGGSSAADAAGGAGATGGSGGEAGAPDLACDHAAVQKACTDGWCVIPAGCFIMGSPKDEWGRGAFDEDQAKVTLTRAFEIQQSEVTQSAWTAQGLKNPSTPPIGPGHSGDCLDANCPVGNVTWYEAAAYANLLSAKRQPPVAPCYELTGCVGELGAGMTCAAVSMAAASPYACEGYRLPTAAEWEYAARAGTKTPFHSGSILPSAAPLSCTSDPNLEKIAWYCANSGDLTHAIGGKEPNAWGLFDMSGNAYEWTNDVTDGIGHGPLPLVDPDESNGFPTQQVLFRGGGPISTSAACRSAAHFFTATRDARAGGFGFRLVRTLPGPVDAGADAGGA